MLVLNTPWDYRIALESCSKKEEYIYKIHIDWLRTFFRVQKYQRLQVKKSSELPFPKRRCGGRIRVWRMFENEFEAGRGGRPPLPVRNLEEGDFDVSELETCVPGGRHLGTWNLNPNLNLQTVPDATESHPKVVLDLVTNSRNAEARIIMIQTCIVYSSITGWLSVGSVTLEIASDNSLSEF